jgi:hypothetical protein
MRTSFVDARTFCCLLHVFCRRLRFLTVTMCAYVLVYRCARSRTLLTLVSDQVYALALRPPDFLESPPLVQLALCSVFLRTRPLHLCSLPICVWRYVSLCLNMFTVDYRVARGLQTNSRSGCYSPAASFASGLSCFHPVRALPG